MKKIAEGELLVHTQKSAKNVDSLRAYLASLRAESQRASVSMDGLAKSILQAGARGLSLGKVVKGLAGAAGFGGFGVAAYLAIDKMTRGLVDAQEESDKLAETLNKAVGAKAGDSIQGTTQKMQSLTNAINESKAAIGGQGAMNLVAAFFFNDDADKAAKAFEKAVETRISLGDKLIKQEAERIAQQKIIMDLDDEMAEVFKINIETRKKLGEIEANDALTSQQKLEMGNLAKEEQADKLRALRLKKEREANKKIFEEKKKEDEDLARDLIKTQEALIKREQALFEKGAKDFKDAQEEKIKAAEEANRQVADASRKAAQKIAEQDAQAQKDFETKSNLGGGLLGASKAGRQDLDVARKLRARQVEQEDFKTQDKAFKELTAQENVKRKAQGLEALDAGGMRRRIAEQQAASEMPSLGEKIQAGMTGTDPASLARETTISNQFKKDMASKSFGAVRPETPGMKGEQSSLSKETLQAITALVDLMKSGTVVK
jgi:hypothetical protein